MKTPITTTPTIHRASVFPATKTSSNIGFIIEAKSPSEPPSIAIRIIATTSQRQCRAR